MIFYLLISVYTHPRHDMHAEDSSTVPILWMWLSILPLSRGRGYLS